MAVGSGEGDFFFFFKVGTKGCLLSTTSSLLIQKNTHDSRTLPPHPQPASLILSQGTFQNGPAQESASQPQLGHFTQ